MLSDYSKTELENLAKLYGYKGSNKLKKQQLLELLKELRVKNMKEILLTLEIEDIEQFEELIVSDKVIDSEDDEDDEAYDFEQEYEHYNDYAYERAPEDEILDYEKLIGLGLVEQYNRNYDVILTVDPTLKAAYENLDRVAIKQKAQSNTFLKKHILGLVNIYGAVEIDWVLKLYQRDYQDELSQKGLIAFIQKDDMLSETLGVIDHYIVEENIYNIDEDNFYHFIKAVQNKPYYVPTQEYIMLMSSPTYYENTIQVQNLKSYIRKNFTQNKALIEEAIFTVVMMGRVDCSDNNSVVEMILQEWDRLFDMRNPVKVKGAIENILRVTNSTRKWINRGYTPDECRPVSLSQNLDSKVTVVDFTRNALCSCGSGKRYKKCCDKKE